MYFLMLQLYVHNLLYVAILNMVAQCIATSLSVAQADYASIIKSIVGSQKYQA